MKDFDCTVRIRRSLRSSILVAAALSLVSAPSRADDEELAQTVQLLLARVAQLEAEVAELKTGAGPQRAIPASLSHPTPEANESEVALPAAPVKASSIDSAIGLAGDGSRATLTLLSETESQEESPTAESPTEHEAAPTVETARQKGAYLPSRGWLEGMYYGSEDFEVATHAFLNLEYVDAGPDGERNGVSTFDNHHANLFVQAQLLPRLRGHMEVEFEHSGDVVEIDQAYVEWGITDWVSLTAGRFYTPFGIERFVWYAPTNSLVSRPEPMRAIIPGNFYANGLQFGGVLETGEASRFTYELAVSDGLGDEADFDRRGSRQTRDNNSSRAVGGRISYAPNPHLELGSSYHFQRYATDRDLDLHFFGLDIAARWRGWELRSEYVDAGVERGFQDPLDLSREPDREQSGYYLQLGYTFDWFRRFFPALTVATRFDSIDLDESITGNDDRDFLSLGLNSLVHNHFRVKLEYRLADEGGVSLDNDTFYTQFVVDF